MKDAARDLGAQLRKAVARAIEDSDATVAAAINVGTPDGRAVAYTDDEISIVHVDGETTLSRPRRGDTRGRGA